VVGDDQVGQLLTLLRQGRQDLGHGGGGVGVPERRAPLVHRDPGELRHHALVGREAQRDPHQLAAGGLERGGGARVDVKQAAGVAGGDQHPLPARGGLAQQHGGAVQGVEGQLGVDGVLAAPVGRVLVDAAALGHHGQHVLLVHPPVAELDAQPVVAIAVRQLAVMGEVVLPRGGNLARDPGAYEMFDQFQA
jgi:hypothetical protein